MSRAVVGMVLCLAVAAAVPPLSARAQEHLIDNMILIGRSETLRLPGVEEVEEHPDAKNPPSLHARMLEEAVFHRPLESRSHPMEGFTLESKPSLLEEAGGRPVELRGRAMPRLPEPLGGGPAASGTPDLDDPGPRDGLTLDAAIERLIRVNRGLQTLRHEIPQAQADTRTAGLLGNPLIFGGASGTPYGRFSGQPGYREYPIVVGYVVDFTGRRRARVRVAEDSERVIEARYRDEVRKKIDALQTAFVDALAARAAVAAARAGVADIDAAIERLGSPGTSVGGVGRLLIERDMTAVALEEAEERLVQARRALAGLLEIPPEEAPRIEPRGSLLERAASPPRDELLRIALNCRPDLVAQRHSVRRAENLVKMEQSRVIRDTYLLYEPWNYEVGQTNQGERGVNTWGISAFAPLPLFDRNQGNIQRARLEVSKLQSQTAVLEREVIDEVDRVLGECESARKARDRIERHMLPAVIRQRDEARRRLRGGRAGVADDLDARRDYNVVTRYYREALVRHRRGMLRLNTAVAGRVLP